MTLELQLPPSMAPVASELAAAIECAVADPIWNDCASSEASRAELVNAALEARGVAIPAGLALVSFVKADVRVFRVVSVERLRAVHAPSREAH